MKLRKQTKRIMIGCVSVAIAAVGTWALGVIPGLPGHDIELGPNAERVEVQLDRVIDGDTFVMRSEVIGIVSGPWVLREYDESQRVRIIGIDTPELGRNGNPDECYAQEATATLTAALSAGPIELVSDPSQGDTDKYGRLLRHVTVNGQSIAVTMLAAGMGHEYTYDTPYAGLADHQAAEAAARDSGTGLWSACQ